jgi:hypothetical protein
MRIEAETLRDLEDSVEPIATETEQKGSDGAVAESQAPAPKPEPRLYRVIWRWRLYAGLLTLPVLLTAAVTGGLYVMGDRCDLPARRIDAGGGHFDDSDSGRRLVVTLSPSAG